MEPDNKTTNPTDFSLKGWIIAMVITLAVCACVFAGFNALIDPFGVFGDKLLNWYAYDMTNNPRVAKIPYLKENHDKYDSYIIGCSKTSSISPEKLGEYYGGASFYSMLMYGGDMYDIEKTAEYILNNYQPKNIVINMGLEEAVSYHVEEDPVKNNLHADVDGSSKLKFYFKYLFLHPQYSLEKLQAYFNQSYLPGSKDVFIPETGVYNKSVRDVEPIGSLGDYMADYPNFNATYGFNDSLPAMADSIASIQRIKERCEKSGATFRLMVSPIYYAEINTYRPEDLQQYWRELAQVTDFWDFSGYTTVSYDPRYFYDAYHFRNTVGDMVLARMFEDSSIYVPDDFGYYVTAENVEQRVSNCFTPLEGYNPDVNSYEIPVLMYHGLGYEADNDGVISPENFEAQIKALKDSGYTAILFKDLTAFVNQGTALPEKSVAITFDDGYQSNYDLAYPILQKYGMPATINIIGVSVGKDTYKDTGKSMYPHFNYDTAREMFQSGLVDFQSHGYDMHQMAALDGEGCRQGVYPLPGETEEEYIEIFREDFLKSKAELEAQIGSDVILYAYPFGFNTTFSEVLLTEMGIQSTVTVDPGMNTIVKGLPQSLLCLKRFNVTDKIGPEDLLQMLGR